MTHREGLKMYETVKVVNGHSIYRMAGTRGCYHITVEQGQHYKKVATFRTIKAAARWAAEN